MKNQFHTREKTMLTCKVFRYDEKNLEVQVNKWLKETRSLKEIVSVTQTDDGTAITLIILYKAA